MTFFDVMKGALMRSRFRFDRRRARLVEGLAQDDAAIDRDDFKLERVAFPVFVPPCGADLVPEGLFALVGDVPGKELGRVGLLVVGFRVCACHDGSPLVCGLARYAIPQDRTEKVGRHIPHGSAPPKWCGQDIDG